MLLFLVVVVVVVFQPVEIIKNQVIHVKVRVYLIGKQKGRRLGKPVPLSISSDGVNTGFGWNGVGVGSHRSKSVQFSRSGLVDCGFSCDPNNKKDRMFLHHNKQHQPYENTTMDFAGGDRLLGIRWLSSKVRDARCEMMRTYTQHTYKLLEEYKTNFDWVRTDVAVSQARWCNEEEKGSGQPNTPTVTHNTRHGDRW